MECPQGQLWLTFGKESEAMTPGNNIGRKCIVFFLWWIIDSKWVIVFSFKELKYSKLAPCFMERKECFCIIYCNNWNNHIMAWFNACSSTPPSIYRPPTKWSHRPPPVDPVKTLHALLPILSFRIENFRCGKWALTRWSCYHHWF
jgi:hypothetical protein